PSRHIETADSANCQQKDQRIFTERRGLTRSVPRFSLPWLIIRPPRHFSQLATFNYSQLPVDSQHLWCLRRRRVRAAGGTVEFGVNLNNREPLITSDYTLADLLDLAEFAENRGFGSVWVGDSLFSKPRFEPISLLS